MVRASDPRVSDFPISRLGLESFKRRREWAISPARVNSGNGLVVAKSEEK